ncbi:MAG: hypothetical protein R3C32_12710 [Chloroflexota bacterium]
MTLAAGYLALTLLSLLAPPAARMGAWLPLHLLAGAAAAAIAGVMPFFSAGVASVPPAPTSVRLVGVLGIATGAGLVVLVRLGGHGAVDNGDPGGGRGRGLPGGHRRRGGRHAPAAPGGARPTTRGARGVPRHGPRLRGGRGAHRHARHHRRLDAGARHKDVLRPTCLAQRVRLPCPWESSPRPCSTCCPSRGPASSARPRPWSS